MLSSELFVVFSFDLRKVVEISDIMEIMVGVARQQMRDLPLKKNNFFIIKMHSIYIKNKKIFLLY